MKTIELFGVLIDLFAVPCGLNNPLSTRVEVELNEHVKRKQNE